MYSRLVTSPARACSLTDLVSLRSGGLDELNRPCKKAFGLWYYGKREGGDADDGTFDEWKQLPDIQHGAS